jgi:hypothetical protein
MDFDYYSDHKWCPACQEYVAYLMSIEHSYCTRCGTEVRLFSQKDWDSFHEGLQNRKPKGGRPRKRAAGGDRDLGRESA